MSRNVFCRCASASFLACFAATTAHATNYVRSYLVNDVLLPTTSSQATSYAIDVDGDGFPDNNIGQVLTALSTQGLDFQGSTDAAVASGSTVYLVGLRSTDAVFKNDPAAQATWCIGAPAATPPKFDGTDNPSCVDTSGNFVAALSGGSFTSPAPATAPNPVSVDITLPIGASNANLTVLNARLSFTINAGGNISVGQINGSIPHDEMLIVFSPAVATACNASIQSDPSAGLSTSCIAIFDTGCTGSPADSGDGLIEVCEVTENAIFHALLAPDVQVDDGGTLVDANSIGFRFTAIAHDRLFANGFEL
jgi:hypothetical protein